MMQKVSSKTVFRFFALLFASVVDSYCPVDCVYEGCKQIGDGYDYAVCGDYDVCYKGYIESMCSEYPDYTRVAAANNRFNDSKGYCIQGVVWSRCPVDLTCPDDCQYEGCKQEGYDHITCGPQDGWAQNGGKCYHGYTEDCSAHPDIYVSADDHRFHEADAYCSGGVVWSTCSAPPDATSSSTPPDATSSSTPPDAVATASCPSDCQYQGCKQDGYDYASCSDGLCYHGYKENTCPEVTDVTPVSAADHRFNESNAFCTEGAVWTKCPTPFTCPDDCQYEGCKQEGYDYAVCTFEDGICYHGYKDITCSESPEVTPWPYHRFNESNAFCTEGAVWSKCPAPPDAASSEDTDDWWSWTSSATIASTLTVTSVAAFSISLGAIFPL